MGKDNAWIDRTHKDLLRQDAIDKLWEIQKLNMGRTPSTEKDADNLSDLISDTILRLQNQIRYADGQPQQTAPEDDGVMKVID